MVIRGQVRILCAVIKEHILDRDYNANNEIKTVLFGWQESSF